MPRYKVIRPGYINDVYHTPGHPRHGHVVTDKPLKPVPSWLQPVKGETAKQRATRLKAAEKAAEEVAKGKKEIDESVNFNSVQTL